MTLNELLETLNYKKNRWNLLFTIPETRFCEKMEWDDLLEFDGQAYDTECEVSDENDILVDDGLNLFRELNEDDLKLLLKWKYCKTREIANITIVPV